MMRVCVFLLVLVAFHHAVAGQEGYPGRHDHHRRHQREYERGGRMFRDLNPQEPRVELETDGGRLEVWGGKGSGVFEDANVAACRTTLKHRGLWLPSYVDSPTMHIVTRGCGRVGIIAPAGDRRGQETTFKVERGDVVAIPEGVVVWWYNDEERDLEIVGAADTTESTRRAGLRAFHLAGGREGEQEGRRRESESEERRRESEEQRRRESREGRRESEGQQVGYGAVIHGFSEEVLARAWEMDRQAVRELLDGQREVGIVRVDKDIRFPDEESQHRNVFFQNFIYRLGKAQPDLRVRNGGEIKEMSSFKLPVLKHLNLGMECVKLQRNAMVAPNWFHNAHQILYVLEGKGKLEVVDNTGEKVLDTQLEEGSLVVIPAFFPSTKIASRDSERGFHYISFITSDRPTMSYLSGSKSVYQGIPPRVLSRMLNVDEERARQIQQAHERESIIFSGEREEDEEHRRRRRGDEQAIVWAL